MSQSSVYVPGDTFYSFIMCKFKSKFFNFSEEQFDLKRTILLRIIGLMPNEAEGAKDLFVFVERISHYTIEICIIGLTQQLS